jgi:hypothetical protein
MGIFAARRHRGAGAGVGPRCLTTTLLRIEHPLAGAASVQAISARRTSCMSPKTCRGLKYRAPIRPATDAAESWTYEHWNVMHGGTNACQ